MRPGCRSRSLSLRGAGGGAPRSATTSAGTTTSSRSDGRVPAGSGRRGGRGRSPPAPSAGMRATHTRRRRRLGQRRGPTSAGRTSRKGVRPYLRRDMDRSAGDRPRLIPQVSMGRDQGDEGDPVGEVHVAGDVDGADAASLDRSHEVPVPADRHDPAFVSAAAPRRDLPVRPARRGRLVRIRRRQGRTSRVDHAPVTQASARRTNAQCVRMGKRGDRIRGRFDDAAEFPVLRWP